ncbi:MAG: hypothetical protein R2939_11910 [Kofleriaceae bacterium]
MLELGRGHPGVARRALVAALSFGGEPAERGRTLRQAGEAAAAIGDLDGAFRHWIDALSEWSKAGGAREGRTRSSEAERLVESARCLWHLGEQAKSLDLIALATSVAPDDADRITEAVAFLLSVDARSTPTSPSSSSSAPPPSTTTPRPSSRCGSPPMRAPPAPPWRCGCGPGSRAAPAAAGSIAVRALPSDAPPWEALAPSTPRQQMQLAYLQAMLLATPGSTAARDGLRLTVAARFVDTFEYADARRRLARSP